MRFAGYLAVFLFGAILGVAVDRENRRGVVGDVVPPGPTIDAGFVAIGKAYVPRLGAAYAEAWTKGAEQLDAGSSPPAALAVVASTWQIARTDLFNEVVQPELAKIVPESTLDADVTAAERAALAAAMRGLARGLSP